MTARVVTIGVYDFAADSFLQRLRQADVRVLLDVRQRRGVRGPEYAWANSLRLQAALSQARIAYAHHPELAQPPSCATCSTPRMTAKGSASARAASSLPSSGTAALLCVERDARACHRSLIARRLTERYHVTIEHLCPLHPRRQL